MITYQGRASRRAAHVARSQLAVRLGLALYAGIATLIALRCLVLLLGLAQTVWSVETILAVSSPLLVPLSAVPAAQRPLVGNATLADLSAALIVLILPLPFLGRASRA